MTALPRKKAQRGTPRRRNYPGRTLYRAVCRSKDPAQVDQMTDAELLRFVLGEQQGAAVAEYLAPRGGLAAFASLGEAGPKGLMLIPGIDEGTAARLLVLWEVSARITEPYRS